MCVCVCVCVEGGGRSFYVLSISLGAKFVCSSVIVTTFFRLAGSPLEVTCMKFTSLCPSIAEILYNCTLVLQEKMNVG